MPANTDPQSLNEQGKQAFQSGQLDTAVDAFRAAAEAYASAHDDLNAAESKNNLSVALLQLGKSQESLDVALGTDDIFAKAGDLKRQGMALGNQAAALEALKNSMKHLLLTNIPPLFLPRLAKATCVRWCLNPPRRSS